METISLKALSNKVLQRNRQGNFKETQAKNEGNFKGIFEGKSFPVSKQFPETISCCWTGGDVPASECVKPCSAWQGQGKNKLALKVSECQHFRAYWAQRQTELTINQN